MWIGPFAHRLRSDLVIVEAVPSYRQRCLEL
jgi:hypothetical protein